MSATPPAGRRRPSVPVTFGPVQPICWPTLTDEDTAAMLAQLTDWVEWLTWRYTLDHRVIPRCWAQHGPHVEELAALFTAWQTAYTTTATGDAPLAWIAHFAAARQRLADWTARTGCRPGEHRAGS